jgi:hypothetical protein
MAKRYRVIFYGLSGNKEQFKDRMVNLNARPDLVDKIINRAPVILKEGLSLEISMRYASAVQRAGGKVEIQEYEQHKNPVARKISVAPFNDFTMCPECGKKQLKRQSCIRCGCIL